MASSKLTAPLDFFLIQSKYVTLIKPRAGRREKAMDLNSLQQIMLPQVIRNSTAVDGVAMYLRLSSADGDLDTKVKRKPVRGQNESAQDEKREKMESNSIESQRMLLTTFIRERYDLKGEVYEYVDDGYTGTNFQRPAFQRMIEDAKRKKFGTIIVKDLSRLGRDYIGVGDYLEQVFPLLGIRFIAVNSHYDSDKYAGTTGGLDTTISNLVNTLYSRDISKKVRAANKTRWQRGENTNNNPCYGYIWKGNGRWEVDPEIVPVIRQIFKRAKAGWNVLMIANELNEQGIEPPGRQWEKRNVEMRRKIVDKEYLWDGAKVRKIIQRYEYTGAAVVHQRETLRVGSKNTKAIDESEQYIHENDHEAIISKEDYIQAQEIFRKGGKRSVNTKRDYPLKGMIFCGNCRLALARHESDHMAWFRCVHKYNAGRKSNCMNDRIPASEMESAVWMILWEHMRILRELGRAAETNRPTGDSFAELEKQIEITKAERIRRYEDYAEGNITREKYIRIKNELTEKITAIEQKIEQLRAEQQAADDEREKLILLGDQADAAMSYGKLDRRAVETFIESIYVYTRDRIEIVFKHEDVIRQAAEKEQQLATSEEATI